MPPPRAASWQSPAPAAWDATSLASALKAAAARRSAAHVLLELVLSTSAIHATSLASLALRSGLPRYARELFDEMPRRDVVSWTSLVTGHELQGLHPDSLTLLRRMVGSGVQPNGYSLSAGGLLACAGVSQSALAHRKEIHASVIKMSSRGPVDPVVENEVLDN